MRIIMNTRKQVLSVSTLALVGLIGLSSAGSALAYQGDYTKQGPNCTAERHEAMETAFEDNDYNAWKELKEGRGRVTQVITEDNFAQFAEAHELAEEGRHEEANTIRQELGLRTNNGERVGAGFSKGMGQGRMAR